VARTGQRNSANRQTGPRPIQYSDDI
jgi:hypothetical protein